MFSRIASGKLFKQSSFLLINSNKRQFISDKRQNHHDVVMIRHAESQFNKACQQYRKIHNIPYVWNDLTNHQGFDQVVLFNPLYMDCHLTEKGKSQCQKMKQRFGNFDVDCILVSPQMRALQTCFHIFEDTKTPVIVQPLLVGPLRSGCDVNKSTKFKKALFPDYDFSPTEEIHELWYLDYLSKQHQRIAQQSFEKKGLQTFEQQRTELVHLLRQKKIYEGSFQYRKRVQAIKNKLKDYRQKYETIALVTHYYTIEYLSAQKYQQCGTPANHIDIKNCTPYFAGINQLLTIQEELADGSMKLSL